MKIKKKIFLANLNIAYGIEENKPEIWSWDDEDLEL